MTPADFAAHFTLDPEVAFLNHGSFGACPRVVQAAQSEWRARLERNPVTFFQRDLEALLDTARARVAQLVGADARGVVFVPNATMAVNAVLASLNLSPGDELLTTNHVYGACLNAMHRWAERAGARVVVVDVPMPLTSPDDVLARVLDACTTRTKLALLDHITSPTGLVFPIEALVRSLRARGVETLVDGAHAPGMVPLALDALGAAYYTGNLHKWICAPKGAALLHVREDLRGTTHALVTSHGARPSRTDRPRFFLEFDWTGTTDPTAVLCVPAAIDFLEQVVPGGLHEVMRLNRAKALAGRDVLCAKLGVSPPAPDSMIGSLAAVALPDAREPALTTGPFPDALQERLFEEHRIEVPIVPFPRWPKRYVRISAQLYVDPAHYARLGDVLSG